MMQLRMRKQEAARRRAYTMKENIKSLMKPKFRAIAEDIHNQIVSYKCKA